MLKFKLPSLAALLLLAVVIKADIPPDPGYKRVSISLEIETKEDLSDYKFYFDFNGEVREIAIKNKGTSTLPPMGGGARYSSGTLLAIPNKNLKEPGKAISHEQLQNSSQPINDNKIELLKHRFSQDVLIYESGTSPVYLIERVGNTLNATKKNGESISSQKFGNGIMLAGILIALAVLMVGILLFRRVLKRG